jgi:hypothetical protein
MADITDADKLGMAALAASSSVADKMRHPRMKKAAVRKPLRDITPADVKAGLVTPGDANDSVMSKGIAPGYRSGGMIDRAAIKGRTKGKIC